MYSTRGNKESTESSLISKEATFPPQWTSEVNFPFPEENVFSEIAFFEKRN